MKKIAVVLSGCGHQDGTEITEAVSTIIALTELGAEPTFFAPDLDVPVQHHREVASVETRNILNESARIARGPVQDIKELKEADFDALVLPGGFGAALHLSNWANDGAKTKVNRELMKAIIAFHKNSKPIGAICIAPAIVARVLGAEGVNVTIGNDETTAAEIEKTGSHHVKCDVTDYVSDRDNKLLTTPAYMYSDASAADVFTGIRKMIRELVEMA
jgi:enhancing lycopene biosynthesis protein 2